MEARAESERFARELLGNISDGRKLNSPVGCSPGRAAKGANPSHRAKTPRRHFCRLGVFVVMKSWSYIIRRKEKNARYALSSGTEQTLPNSSVQEAKTVTLSPSILEENVPSAPPRK